MEKKTRRIAENIGAKFSYDSEKIAVITYGLTAIFQMLIIFFFVSFFGIIGDFWFEGMIIFLFVGFLRKSTGGAHNSTFTGCLLFSIFSICFMAFLSRYLCNSNLIYLYSSISFITFIISFFTIYKYSPVASPNKPILNPRKIKRLRRNSFITLAFYVLLSALFFAFSKNNDRYSGFGISITLSVLWQSFMLTRTGHTFIKIIDQKVVDF